MNVWQNNPVICLKTMLAAARFIKVRDPTLANAILERLIHSAYKIELKGDSMRKKKSILTKSEA
jgi:DNA replication protein DnaC